MVEWVKPFDGDYLWWVAQVIGAFAMVIGYGALLLKDDKYHINGTSLSALIDSLHWFLLSANTAGVFAALIALRTWMAGRPPSNKRVLSAVFLVLFIAAAAFTWSGIASSLILFSVLVATGAYFYTTGIALRVWLIICNIPWIFYSLINESVAGATAGVVAIVFLLAAIYRISEEQP